MSDTTDEAEIETGKRHMTVRRTVAVPRNRVWEAWTSPDQVGQWWGPDGFTTTTEEMDVQPGGVWAFEMVGPDGDVYPNRIVYDEIVRPERLAYTHGSPDEPEMFQVTVAFDERNGGATEVTMESRYPSPEALDDALEFGADDGAAQTLGRLAEYLSRLDAAGGGER